MNLHSFGRLRGGSATSFYVGAMLFSMLLAGPEARALDSSQVACEHGIAAAAGNLAKVVLKAEAACARGRLESTGRDVADCASSSRMGRRIESAVDAIAVTTRRRCRDTIPLFEATSSDCAVDCGGGSDATAAAARCLACMVRTRSVQLARETFATASGADPSGDTCRRHVGQATIKYLGALLDGGLRCEEAKQAGKISPDTDCGALGTARSADAAVDLFARIAKAVEGKDRQIDHCQDDAHILAINSCGSDLTSEKRCVASRVEKAALDLHDTIFRPKWITPIPKITVSTSTPTATPSSSQTPTGTPSQPTVTLTPTPTPSNVVVGPPVTISVAGAVICPPLDAADPMPPSLPPAANGPSGAAGTIPGNFSVSSDGAAVYTMNLEVPPGRHGMQPALSITYNSFSGETPLGVGFSLGGPASIGRCPKNLEVDGEIRPVLYDSADAYCFGELRLVTIPDGWDSALGIQEYRTFPDTFARVLGHLDQNFQPLFFEVFEKNGRLREFGATPDSKLLSYGVAGTWALDREQDRYGNEIHYKYWTTGDGYNSHEQLLDRIEYVGSTDDVKREVQFNYEPLPKNRVLFGGGTHLRRTQRLSSIWMLGPNQQPVRSYWFTYDPSNTSRSMLTQIQQCAANSKNVCLPATTFDWPTPPGLFDYSISDIFMINPQDQSFQWLLVDVNGDGLDDLLRVYRPSDGHHEFSVALATGGLDSAPYDTPQVWLDMNDPDGFKGVKSGAAPSGRWEIVPIDIDQDGNTDLLLDEPYNHGSNLQWLRSVPGQKTFQVMTSALPHWDYSTVPDSQINGADAAGSGYRYYFGSRLADIDGDGVADYIRCLDPQKSWEGATWTLHRWLPATHDFDPVGTLIAPLSGYGCAFNTNKIWTVDTDRDGGIEIIGPVTGVEYGSTRLKSDGTWTSWQPLGVRIQDWTHRIHFFDINADGLPDALQTGLVEDCSDGSPNPICYGDDSDQSYFNVFGFHSGDAQIQFNSGDGFLQNVPGQLPQIADPDGKYMMAFADSGRPIDYDNDGRNDFLLPMANSCSGGNSADICWVILHSEAGATWQGSEVGAKLTPLFTNIHWIDSRDRNDLRLTDVDGDGSQDFVAISDTGFKVYRSEHQRDALRRITDGQAPRDRNDADFVPSIEIEYGGLIDLQRTWQGINTENVGNSNDGSIADPKQFYQARAYSADCDYPLACTVGSRQVVRKYKLQNGNNGQHAFAMRYRDGRYDRRGHRELGFGARFTIDFQTLGGNAQFYDNEAYNSGLHVYPYAGKAKRTWNWYPALSGQPKYDQVMIEFGKYDLGQQPTNGGKTYFTLTTFSRSRTQEAQFGLGFGGLPGLLDVIAQAEKQPLAVLRESYRQVIDYDLFGNIRAEVREAAAADSHTEVTRIFSNDVDTWLIGRETTNRECNTAMGMTQCRDRSYVLNAQGDVGVEHAGDVADPTTQLDTTYDRDTFGNVVRTTQQDLFGNTRATCSTYDADGVFPIASNNLAGHHRYTRYDRGFGVPIASQRPDGFVTRAQYDELGRLAREQRADGTWTNYTHTRDKQGGPQQQWWRTRSNVTSDDGSWVETESDSLGRVVRRTSSAAEGPTCETYGGCQTMAVLAEDTVYDDLGRLVAHSTPYVDGVPWSVANKTFEELTIDGFGRPIQIVKPWGQKIAFEYSGNVTTRTDYLGSTSNQFDTLGRVVSTVDTMQNSTQFTYGPFSLLWQVSAFGLSNTDQFDAYGRRLVHMDPDRGTSFATYNGFGDLVSETDALARTYTNTYDSVGRVVQRVDGDGTTLWQYDLTPKGKGKIGHIESPDGTVKDYQYDNHGRLHRLAISVGGETFDSIVGYDGHSRKVSLQYPADLNGNPYKVQYHYDSTGHLSSIDEPGNPVPLWQLLESDSGGRIRREVFGNGFHTVREFDSPSGMVTRIETENPLNHKDGVQSLFYEYDEGLNLYRRGDDLQTFGGPNGPKGVVETFGYDALQRVTCSFLSAKGDQGVYPCALSVGYEPNGNIKSKSDVGGYTYDSNHPHAVQIAGMSGFEYDAVGNQIGRPGVVLSYTAFDLPRQYVFGGDFPTVTFDYSGDQGRVRKSSSVSETVWLNNIYERVRHFDSGLIEHKYHVFAGDRMIATVDHSSLGVKTYFPHMDHLGSIDVISDESSQIAARFSFDPFGNPRSASWGSAGPVVPLFTFGYSGHESDEEIGVVNMGGRVFDPVIGRFLTTDPTVAHPKSSQGWNRYSYVQNRVMTVTDPTGFTDPPPNPAGGETTTAAGAANPSMPAFEKSAADSGVPTEDIYDDLTVHGDEEIYDSEMGLAGNTDPDADQASDQAAGASSPAIQAAAAAPAAPAAGKPGFSGSGLAKAVAPVVLGGTGGTVVSAAASVKQYADATQTMKSDPVRGTLKGTSAVANVVSDVVSVVQTGCTLVGGCGNVTSLGKTGAVFGAVGGALQTANGVNDAVRSSNPLDGAADITKGVTGAVTSVAPNPYTASFLFGFSLGDAIAPYIFGPMENTGSRLEPDCSPNCEPHLFW